MSPATDQAQTGPQRSDRNSADPVPSAQPFGLRLQQQITATGQLCMGIDPSPQLLAQWGLRAGVAGLGEFSARAVEAAVAAVGIIKYQVGFYEAYGPGGLQVLAESMAHAREAGLMVIADAKRGDIGSTMEAYAQAWLTPQSPFSADALTLNPYLGVGALEPAIRTAAEHGRGVFILGITSNPEGAAVQLPAAVKLPGAVSEPAAQQAGYAAVAGAGIGAAGVVVADIAQRNRSAATQTQSSSGDVSSDRGCLADIGLVIGATTISLATAQGMDLRAGNPPLLAPGYGAQGAAAADIKRQFGELWPQVLVNSSRGILREGPDTAALITAARTAQRDLAQA